MRDMQRRSWSELDIVLITGDAYVDHPAFGAAVIGRVLEHAGYRVGIIAQPDWKSTRDFLAMGKPRLFCGITSGNVDSMLANYTANKRPREGDDYSPGGKSGLRPDRAVIVYANRAREAYGKDVPIVLGGIEASLRRMAHYDYWDDKVRRSILLDAKADILVYGMGESAVLEIARRLSDKAEVKTSLLDDIPGTVVVRNAIDHLDNPVIIPSFEDVKKDKVAFNRAFLLTSENQDPFTARPVVQRHGNRCVIQMPPPQPLETRMLDEIYALPYQRDVHPSYHSKIKAIETVRFSIISHRGCAGQCSFCGLYFHQGRIVQSRSPESILDEARTLSQRKDFRGTITDVGGPTANLYQASCRRWEDDGVCRERSCLRPKRCHYFEFGYSKSLELLEKISSLPGVKHVFLSSGFRYDLLTAPGSNAYLETVCKNHISGYMKIAPEHICDSVLKQMNKPDFGVYETFVKRFDRTRKGQPRRVFLVNYFLSAHPGSTLADALNMALFLRRRGIKPEQVQDFIPLPMTASGCMYHTGRNPFTGEKVYVARTFRERKKQRALIQYGNPKNRKLVEEALRDLGAPHLVRKFYPSKDTQKNKRRDGDLPTHPLKRKRRK